jgi:hypothetical protein
MQRLDLVCLELREVFRGIYKILYGISTLAKDLDKVVKRYAANNITNSIPAGRPGSSASSSLVSNPLSA